MPKQVKDATAANESLKFFAWAYKNGDKAAEELDYVPMPANVKELVMKSWAEIKGPDGKPPWPACDGRRATRFFASLTRSAAYLVLTLLGGFLVTLIIGSWLALSTFGVGFLTSQSWNPNPDILKFGALTPIYGTPRHLGDRDGARLPRALTIAWPSSPCFSPSGAGMTAAHNFQDGPS